MWVFWKELVKRALPKKRDALGVQCKELIKENSQVWLDDKNHRSLLAKDGGGGRFLSLTHTHSRSHAQSHFYPHLKQTRIRAVQQHRSENDIHWSARLGDHEPNQKKWLGMEFYPIEQLSARRLLRVGNSSTQLDRLIKAHLARWSLFELLLIVPIVSSDRY